MARIFLIENDPQFADCLRNILVTEGFDVVSVKHFQGVVPVFEDPKPALTIVNMQHDDQVSVDHIRELSESPEAPPILVTADYKSPDLACKALGAGAKDYLLKPFCTREFVDRVHSLAGTGKNRDSLGKLDNISDSIQNLSSLDDVLGFTLDQLEKSLNLADCLICVREESSFRVIASHGYIPDPIAKPVTLSSDELVQLTSDCVDPLAVTSGLATTIAGLLGVKGHRPFPTIMPLTAPSSSGHMPELIGFVMGHGALVVKETDILEMELFLSRITPELVQAGKLAEILRLKPEIEYENELLIPDTDRDSVTNEILGIFLEYLHHDSDEFWIRLVLDEAVNNAILHGHGESLNQIELVVKVKYAAGAEKLMLTVEDSGDGFDFSHVPDPTADENLLSINGRGIFLMRSIMDSVLFNDKGNIVTMIKYLDGKPLGPSSTDIFDQMEI